MKNQQLEQSSINTIRTLSIDAVQQAKSGHPGTPMCVGPLVYTIWKRVMNFDPKDPVWTREHQHVTTGFCSMYIL
jgi:transketolase